VRMDLIYPLVSAQLPPLPATAQYPNSSVGSPTPVMRWTQVSAATGYTLYVYTSANAVVFSGAVSPTCDGSVCRYTYSAGGLTAGSYKWAVRASNAVGYSSTSNWLKFILAAPAAPTAQSPTGTAGSPTPIFKWTQVSGATGYNLYVYTSANAQVFSGAVTPTCDGTSCRYTYSAGLTVGSYKWAVKSKNAAGYSPTSNWLNFNLAAPAAPNTVSPNGIVKSALPTFTWSKVSGATGYTLYIYTSTNTNVFAQNVSATCGSSTCSYTLTSALSVNNYKWTARSRNAIGTSASGTWRNFCAGSPTSDSDGDGLPNHWEVCGYDYNNDGTADVNLPALGANWRKKDLFVEADYMVSPSVGNLGPYGNMLTDITNIFANAPVSNPDGTTGITIHVDASQQVPYDYAFGTCSSTQACIDAVWAEFDTYKAAYFPAARSNTHRYMIFANRWGDTTSSGMARDIPATNFIVALGGWTSGGSYYERLGTFVHELGHTLGLTHGGGGSSDHVNYKPNYLSIMNYSFQMRGLRKNSHWGNEGYPANFDYQRMTLGSLNELSLNEAAGLGANATNYGTIWYITSGSNCNGYYTDNAVSNVNYNMNGSSTESGYAQDINCSGGYSTLLATQNNWANINYNGGGILGSGVSPQKVEESIRAKPAILLDELTFEENQKLEQFIQETTTK